MPWDNRENPAKGRVFQEKVSHALAKRYGVEFLKEYPISIGNPPKDHKFDLVSVDSKYVVECKAISWTETGNIPSAKMAFCNQAIFYLSLVPHNKKRLLVIQKNTHPRRQETLAQYYKRTNRHLLNDIIVVEFDPESGKLTEI
ncbi:MAG: hypothetical protein KAW13_02105 [Dehalococcoidia bacterium]|nr:hypothetical protein [Dehalococcoidia bacterium]